MTICNSYMINNKENIEVYNKLYYTYIPKLDTGSKFIIAREAFDVRQKSIEMRTKENEVKDEN